MKRSPLKRKTRLKAVSQKRSKQLREYAKLRKLFLEEHPECERCGKPAIDIHHKAKRNGERLNDTSMWMAACRKCHDWIETHLSQAEKEGYIIRIYP